MSRRVAVAAVSAPAAGAGVRMASEGGNAVDAALACSLVAVVTHPGMCSLGGGGFLVVWPDGEDPVAVDGALAMPGRGVDREAFGGGAREARLDYAGGVTTLVGPGSVAVPGLLAACAVASRRWGRVPWRILLEPAVEAAREGFPMPETSHRYLGAAGEIYGADPRSRRALYDGDGALLAPGEPIRVEGLADTLDALAREGPELLYRGELGAAISGHLREGGGLLTRADLEAYEARLRRPLAAEVDGWGLAAHPEPARGGRRLLRMLELLGDAPPGPSWTAADVARLARAQLEAAREEPLAAGRGASGETLHTSAVDDTGTACAATFSDGYGSGVVPPGTGMWLNNCLGEEELNPHGFHGWAPDDRLPSNMTPLAARRRADGAALALGSPGSERIPGAVLQGLLHRIRLGLPPREAVEHPRLHVDPGGPDGEPRVLVEPGLPVDEIDLPVEVLPGRLMYMGALELAEWSPRGGLAAAADGRRGGGTAVGGVGD